MSGITPGPTLEAKTAFFFIKICKIKKKKINKIKNFKILFQLKS